MKSLSPQSSFLQESQSSRCPPTATTKWRLAESPCSMDNTGGTIRAQRSGRSAGMREALRRSVHLSTRRSSGRVPWVPPGEVRGIHLTFSARQPRETLVFLPPSLVQRSPGLHHNTCNHFQRLETFNRFYDCFPDMRRAAHPSCGCLQPPHD